MPTKTLPAPAVRLDDWNLLRSFLAVFEFGTLTAAADALGLTQPTVGRHVRDLEALMGETLFDRLPGRMQPTRRAEVLVARLSPLRDGVAAVEQALHSDSQQIAGCVKITSTELFGALLLPRLLAPLQRAEPALQIELHATDAVENLLRREADIAVRLFRPDQDDVVGMSIGHAELGLYAQQGFIDALPRLDTPSDLRGRWVGEIDLQRTFEIAHATGFPLQPQDFVHRAASSIGQLSAIEAGIGVGATFSMFAAQRPQLRRLFPDVLAVRVPVWLCAHEDLRRSARIACVFDHLAAVLKPLLADVAAAPAARSDADAR